MSRLLLLAIFLPALAAAQARCRWLNTATAGGVLGGTVEVTVTPTRCEFVRQGITLTIEVTSANAPAAHCGPGAESLKAIGNQSVACEYEGKPGWTGEQVVGTVRDQAFLVRMTTSEPSLAKTLREKARKIAEQVAGILF
jgi:hypothetical protein